ncbi:MAG: NAD(P)/FAD-dependent oxidoreductase, partial [Gemmatimonadaceae bacterium]
MQNIVILGAGTGGTVMANRLARRYKSGLRIGEVRITLVDQDPVHLYQPGLLFIPFGAYTRDQVVQPRAAHVNDKVRYVQSAIDRLDPATDTVA